MRHIWILLILPFALPAQRTLIADDAEIKDSLSLAGEWISQIRKDTNFWASTHGEVPSTRAILEWFGAQSAGIPGTGNEGFLTYWDSDSTLAYINVSYTATELNASALTGSFQWPTGTTAQQPIGANGKTRFNSTTGLFEGYHDAAYRPFATFDGTRTANRIPYWNGTTLTSASGFLYGGGLTNNTLSFSHSSSWTRITHSGGFSSDAGLRLVTSKHISLAGGNTQQYNPGTNYGWSQPTAGPYYTTIGSLGIFSRGIGILGGGGVSPAGDDWTNRAELTFHIGSDFNTVAGKADPAFIRGISPVVAHSGGNPKSGGDLYISGGSPIAGSGGLYGNILLSMHNTTETGLVGIKTNTPAATLDVNGDVRIRTLPDSVAAYIATADASGYIYRATPADIVAAGYYAANGEYVAADTLTITSAIPVKLEGSTAGVLSNITHSSGRLTYTGSTTYTFGVDFSASIDASAGAEVSFGIYKNGSLVSGSKQVHKITPGEINVVSTGCFVSLAQNDYVEVFFDVDTSCDVYIRNSNLKIKKI